MLARGISIQPKFSEKFSDAKNASFLAENGFELPLTLERKRFGRLVGTALECLDGI
ncbi:MAG TPA: hypothetical protein VI874_03945 [Candidatus Norongarragalinales archaeon]|nr:hypothetical protein [Candidatus Norongarragalinales archaeon]